MTTENTLRELIYGKGAHVDPVACIEDISAELAARRVPGYPHSIWQIVMHMNYWMDYELRKIAGENPHNPDHAIEAGPNTPIPQTPRNCRTQTADGKPRVSTSSTTLLNSPSSPTPIRQRWTNWSATSIPRRSRARPAFAPRSAQISAHNSYHVGQIALLRRQAGAMAS